MTSAVYNDEDVLLSEHPALYDALKRYMNKVKPTSRSPQWEYFRKVLAGLADNIKGLDAERVRRAIEIRATVTAMEILARHYDEMALIGVIAMVQLSHSADT